MDMSKQNTIISGSIFAALVIVPLVIGLSVYTRPDAAPIPPAAPPAPIVYHPAPPPQPAQTRYAISGNAYNVESDQPIVGLTITAETGQSQISGMGFFS